MRTSKKLVIGLAFLAVSVGDARAQLSDIQLFEFDPEKGADVRRIGNDAAGGYSLKEIGWGWNRLSLIDFTYRKTDRSRTGKYSHIVFPTMTRIRVHDLVLTGNNLTNLTIPPLWKSLRNIVLDGNVNLKVIRLQQDTCTQSSLRIDFAGMERLRIEAPRRLRGRIIVNGRNALDLHPLVIIQDREDKLEIVKWPYLVREFELRNKKDPEYLGGTIRPEWISAIKRIVGVDFHVGLCSPNGRQIQFTQFSELYDPWAPIRWNDYNPAPHRFGFSIRSKDEIHMDWNPIDKVLVKETRESTDKSWVGDEFFGYNFGEEKMPPLIQHDTVSFKVRYYHPSLLSIHRLGNIYPEEIGGWVDDEVVFKEREGWAYKHQDIVYRVRP